MARKRRSKRLANRRRRGSNIIGDLLPLAVIGGLGYALYACWDSISSGVSSAIGTAEDTVSGAISSAEDAASSAVQSGEDYVETGIQNVETDIETGIQNFENQLKSMLPSWMGGGSSS